MPITGKAARHPTPKALNVGNVRFSSDPRIHFKAMGPYVEHRDPVKSDPLPEEVGKELERTERSWRREYPDNIRLSAIIRERRLLNALHPNRIYDASDLLADLIHQKGISREELHPWVCALQSLNVRLSLVGHKAFQGSLDNAITALKADAPNMLDKTLQAEGTSLTTNELMKRLHTLPANRIRSGLTLLEIAGRVEKVPCDKNPGKGGQMWGWVHTEHADKARLAPTNLGFQLLRMLHEGPKTLKELNEATKANHRNIHTYLARFEEAGLLDPLKSAGPRRGAALPRSLTVKGSAIMQEQLSTPQGQRYFLAPVRQAIIGAVPKGPSASNMNGVRNIIQFYEVRQAYDRLRAGRTILPHNERPRLYRQFGIGESKLDYILQMKHLPVSGISRQRLLADVMPVLKREHPAAYKWFGNFVVENFDRFPAAHGKRLKSKLTRAMRSKQMAGLDNLRAANPNDFLPIARAVFGTRLPRGIRMRHLREIRNELHYELGMAREHGTSYRIGIPKRPGYMIENEYKTVVSMLQELQAAEDARTHKTRNVPRTGSWQ